MRGRGGRLRVVVAGLALPLLAAWAPARRPSATALASAPAPGFVLVVNAANPATSVKKMEVVRIFTRKMRAWPGGLPATPVDQRDASAVRKEFLAVVMGKDAAAMNAYWQSQVFVGRTTPPPVKGSDAEVLAFVAATAGGLGYVAPTTPLPESVKAIAVEN